MARGSDGQSAQVDAKPTRLPRNGAAQLMAVRCLRAKAR